MKTLLAIDFDKWACATYAANFPGVRVECGPVRNFIPSLPRADVVMGGPPCQGFSLAGEGLGEHDERDGIPDFIDAVCRVQPRHFLMENVRGLITAKHWPYFCRAIDRLTEECGYNVQWRLLDAVNYGVPQFRERVWVWGIRNDLYAGGMRHRWPMATHAWPPPEPCMFGATLLPGVTVGQALGIGNDLHRRRGKSVVRRDHPPCEPSPPITSAFALGGGGGLFLRDSDEETETGEVQQVQEIAATFNVGSCGNIEVDGEQPAVRGLRSGTVPPNAEPVTIYAHGLEKESGVAEEIGDGWIGGGLLAKWEDWYADTVDHGGTWLEFQKLIYPRAGEPGEHLPPSRYECRVCGLEHCYGETHEQYLDRSVTYDQQGHGNVKDRPLELEAPSPTMRNCLPGCSDIRVHEYRWSDEMLRKHPPALPASPAPTVQAKWLKGGAEGLIRIVADPKHEPHEPAGTLRSGGRGHGMPNLYIATQAANQSPCPTISAGSHQGGPEPVNNRIRAGFVRRLTPLECARLQSMPDDFAWPEKITKTNMYRIVGNGQASLMVLRLSEAMRAVDPEAETVIDLFCGGGVGAVGWHGRVWVYEEADHA